MRLLRSGRVRKSNFLRRIYNPIEHIYAQQYSLETRCISCKAIDLPGCRVLRNNLHSIKARKASEYTRTYVDLELTLVHSKVATVTEHDRIAVFTLRIIADSACRIFRR